jgi:hypothetical protein
MMRKRYVPASSRKSTGKQMALTTLPNEEIESARNIDSLRESYKASLSVLREQFLNKLIIKKGFYDENAIDGYLKEYGMNIGGANKWVVCKCA